MTDGQTDEQTFAILESLLRLKNITAANSFNHFRLEKFLDALV